LVLDTVSLEVGSGELVAVVGPSGSGKSTVLAILGLLARPDSGVVAIDGRPVPSRGRERQGLLRTKVSWVFQGEKLLAGRTALDNVGIAALARGASLGSARTLGQMLLSDVGLANRGDELVDSFSGGEAQRVCIARALGGSPSVVLADEPTGQLDASNTVVVLDALRTVGSRAALVIATRDEVVASRCDRVVRISSGRLVECG